MVSKRTKALAIPRLVKLEVWERDNRKCILCGSHKGEPNAHYLPRSAGGLGNTPRNIVTLCWGCHIKYDQTTERKLIKAFIKSYLKSKYKDWDESQIKYYKESEYGLNNTTDG